MRTTERTSDHVGNSDSQAEASFVSLQGVGKDRRPLVLGTLSWSVLNRVPDLLGRDLFLSTLDGLKRSGAEWDFLLASGRTLSSEPSTRDVLERTSGAPALFEVANSDDTARWLLAHEGLPDRAEVLRTSQVLFKRKDEPGDPSYKRLVNEIAVGHGVIRIGRRGLTLILFICGKNNAIRYDAEKTGEHSALYYSNSKMNEVMSDCWVALNPAHRPYGSHTYESGFGKVGKVGDGGEIMARTVTRRRPYDDGTRPPIAFIHCNNFYSEVPETQDYASVGFGPQGSLTPTATAEGIVTGRGSDKVQWRFSAYEIMV